MQVFVKGEIIYKVYALLRSNESWIEKLEVVAYSTMLDEKVPALIVLHKGRKDKISLRDGNVIPNRYNSHRIFKSKDEAEIYAANPSQWRPLGISWSDWEKFAKDDYLAESDLDSFFNTWDAK